MLVLVRKTIVIANALAITIFNSLSIIEFVMLIFVSNLAYPKSQSR
jgi:hypothetical protein